MVDVRVQVSNEHGLLPTLKDFITWEYNKDREPNISSEKWYATSRRKSNLGNSSRLYSQRERYKICHELESDGFLDHQQE